MLPCQIQQNKRHIGIRFKVMSPDVTRDPQAQAGVRYLSEGTRPG